MEFTHKDQERARVILQKGSVNTRASVFAGQKVRRADTILQADKQRHLSLATWNDGHATTGRTAQRPPRPAMASHVQQKLMAQRAEEEAQKARAVVILKGMTRLQAVYRGRKARAQYRVLGESLSHRVRFRVC